MTIVNHEMLPVLAINLCNIVIQLIPMGKKLCFCLPAILLSLVLSAQVPVRLEPRHKVALENHWIRLLDVRLPPGDTSLFHIHEIPSFFMPLSTTALGIEVKGQTPQETKFSVGTNWYNGFEKGPLVHKVWNIDTNTLHVIDLELLSTKNSDLPSVQLPNSEIDFENEKLRVYKFELAPGQNLSLPFLKTPMLLISVSGHEMQVKNLKKKNAGFQIKAGGFQWLESEKKFELINKGASGVNGILILLK